MSEIRCHEEAKNLEYYHKEVLRRMEEERRNATASAKAEERERLLDQLWRRWEDHERDNYKAPYKTPDLPDKVKQAVIDEFMKKFNKNDVNEVVPELPPREPHDPFDLKFVLQQKHLTGQIVLAVHHNCDDEETWNRKMNAHLIKPTINWGSLIGGSAGGSSMSYSNPQALQNSPNGMWGGGPPAVANGHTAPMTATMVKAMQQWQGVHGQVSSPKSNFLGTILLTLPECPEFERMKDAVQCEVCKALITGDIMRVAYFKQLVEKL